METNGWAIGRLKSWASLWTFSLLGAIALWGCGSAGPQFQGGSLPPSAEFNNSAGSAESRPSPIAQPGPVRAFFNHNPASQYRDPYRGIERSGDDLEGRMVQLVESARSTVVVAVQELRLPRLAQALVDRHRAGLQVRVILENSASRPWSSYSPEELAQLSDRERSRIEDYFRLGDRNGDGTVSEAEVLATDAMVMLAQAGVPTLDDTADGSKGSGLMHHKFIVVDGNRSIITSANFTLSDVHGDMGRPASRGNPNNLLEIDSPVVAGWLLEEFGLMWGDGPGGQPDSRFGTNKPLRPLRSTQVGDATIGIQFSPMKTAVPFAERTNGVIAATVGPATRSIDVALFVFSEQAIADAMETAHRRGAKVRVLVDPSFLARDYSEALDLLGVTLRRRTCELEPNQRPWNPPITTVGSPELPMGDLLHHKFGLVDGQTVVTGSHNWSAAADRLNDETLLVVKHPIVATLFQREFDRLWSNATTGLTPKLKERLAADRARCGS